MRSAWRIELFLKQMYALMPMSLLHPRPFSRGLRRACDLASSARLRGMSQKLLFKRTLIDQAAPPSVDQLGVLEYEVEKAEDSQQRVFSLGMRSVSFFFEPDGAMGNRPCPSRRTHLLREKSRLAGWSLALAGPVTALRSVGWFDAGGP
eukprot:2780222-Amphidinium_carterae.1